MTLVELCDKIYLPASLTGIVLAVSREPQYAEWVRLGRPLLDPAGGEEGYRLLSAALDPDPNGLRMLSCQLGLALETHEAYRAAGIPDEIFFATMGCFSRFAREYQKTFGCCGFDRGWWTGRQLSQRLFRIGELEFEILRGEEPRVSIHIPSDADLTPEKPLLACREADTFLRRQGHAVPESAWECSSWLLSPDLPRFLSAGSRLLAFQALFDITVANEDDRSYRQWLFQDARLEPKDFPENTSLQRSIKAFILSGNRFRSGCGRLKAGLLQTK